MKTRTIICASIMAMAAGLTAGCLLNGCAREHSHEAVYQSIQPGAGNNAPLSYQWYSTNGNPATATFSVTAAGTPTLHYDWSFATNGGTQPFNIGGGTNGPLSYQWSFTNGDALSQQLNVGAVGLTNGSEILGPSNINSSEWGQSITFPTVGGTNGPLLYEWYKNTNSQ
jgi:hypothetical protein